MNQKQLDYEAEILLESIGMQDDGPNENLFDEWINTMPKRLVTESLFWKDYETILSLLMHIKEIRFGIIPKRRWK